MFWGLIMEPLKRYSQTVGKSFHISQASMDTTTGDNEPCQIMVVVNGQNYLICTLQKGKIIQTPLDLNFRKGDDIAFITNGKCHVHLTGYLDPFGDEYDDEEGEEEEEEDLEDEEEAPELVEAKSKKVKRKLDTSAEMNNSKNKKIKKDNKRKQEDSDDSDSDDDSESYDEDDLKKLLEEADSDEADESYRPDTSKDEDDEDEEESDEDDVMDMDESGDEEGEGSSEEEKPTPQKKQEEKQLSKKAKKKLKKQQQQEQQGTPQQNGMSDKKKDKSNKENGVEKSPGSAQKEKKVLTGNVAIEDLKVGQGPTAKPGKMIQVYYEGRLKSNNKQFDSCQKGPGFKFRLGKNEVIRGWDVGVQGMKVGGKRRIVCPPGMAYGNKGSPPLIPPNSTLVFDVELKGVN